MFLGHRGPYRRSAPARLAILEAVRLRPGSSRSEIQRLTGLSWGSVAHHAKRLLERGELHVHVIGRRPYYSVDPNGSKLLPLARLLRTEQAAGDILRVLNRSGALSIQALSRDLRVDRKTVKRHLGSLLQAGLVGLTQRHRRARFELRSVPLELRTLLRPTDEPASA